MSELVVNSSEPIEESMQADAGAGPNAGPNASPGSGAASVLLRWLGRASLAAALVSLIELTLLVLPVGYASSSSLGLLAYLWSSHALLFLGLLPAAALAAFAETRRLRPRLPPAASLLAFALLLLVVMPFSRPLLLFRHGQRNEFPFIVAKLPATMLMTMLLVSAALGYYLVWPAVQWLRKKFPHILADAHIYSLCLAMLAVLAMWTSYSALEPLNKGLLAGIAALGGALLWLLAMRNALAKASRSWLLALVSPALLFFLLLPVGLSGLGHMHGRFLLFNDSIAARMVGARLQALFDFDGDGSAPTWLGGADCAPFDGERGPGVRDLPGDGIDQDCSGHDRVLDTASAAQELRCTPSEEPLSLMLITLDAWRFDTIFGEFTPGISAFAKHALFFGRAYAPANLTRQTTAAMLSGRPNDELRAKNPLIVDEPVSTNALPLAASAAGMATVALHHLDFPPGYNVGFGPPASGPWLESETAPRGAFMEDLRSAGMTGEILSWLTRIGNKRFFAWVHYTDPHAPYLSANGQGGLAKYNGTYWGEVAYADYHVSRLLNALKDRGLLQHTAIAITADHGEELGDYHRQGHGTNVFENTAHVPLILWVPGCQPGFVEDPVSLNQLPATFAALAGLEIPGLSLLARAPSPADGVVSEAVSIGFAGDEGFFKRAFIYQRYKLIIDLRRGGMLLFDLSEDPAETQNIWYEQPKVRATVLAAYRKWLDHPRP